MFELRAPIYEEVATALLGDAAKVAWSVNPAHYIFVGNSRANLGLALEAITGPGLVTIIPFSATCGSDVTPHVENLTRCSRARFSSTGTTHLASPLRAGVVALRAHYATLGFTPKSIMQRAGVTAFFDHVNKGTGFASFVEFVLAWGEEEGISAQRLAKKMLLVDDNGMMKKPWQFILPRNPLFGPLFGVRHVMVPAQFFPYKIKGEGMLLRPVEAGDERYCFGSRLVPRLSAAGIVAAKGDVGQGLQEMNRHNSAEFANLGRIMPLLKARLRQKAEEMRLVKHTAAPAAVSVNRPMRWPWTRQLLTSFRY